jgi:hypothetical protein
MTTLAVNKPRAYDSAPLRHWENAIPVIASDIIYEGAAVGVVSASGHARPLAAGDKFAGFAVRKVDNSAGAAAAKRVDVYQKGFVQLSVTGAVITDKGLPVYATDDDTFSFSPVGGVFVGFLHRYVSAGVGVVAFDALNFVDPWDGYVHELKSANYTVDAEDSGKMLWVDTDAVVITLPAVEGITVGVGNIAAFGVAKVSVDPNAVDMIEGPDITAADNKDIINTKATARRGDHVIVANGDANGWKIVKKVGTWAREA